MKPYAVTFYSSGAWKKCRAAYTKSQGGLCERCRARGLIVPGEIVHHRIHLTPANISDESITLNPDNLELLCRDCHAQEHDGLKLRYHFDEYGSVQTIPE